MTKDSTPSAKEQVLAWVRSKNPQTMDTCSGCNFYWRFCSCNTMELGSDMGLQELLIALEALFTEAAQAGKDTIVRCDVNTMGRITFGAYRTMRYDLTKNLHNQPEDFYSHILPLIHG